MSAPLILPWPSRKLSPNSRTDRRYSTRERASYKDAAYWLAVEAGLKNLRIEAPHLRITFHPPCRRKRDLDNLLGSIKYGLDGIARAVGIDDSEWGLTIAKGDPVPNGQVHVEIGVMRPTGFRPCFPHSAAEAGDAL